MMRHFEYYSDMSVEGIMYSEKYDDEAFEYRHVTLPQDLAKLVPRNHLMTETEWRNLGYSAGIVIIFNVAVSGVQQSPGWIHFMFHTPEPHILQFRRPKG